MGKAIADSDCIHPKLFPQKTIFKPLIIIEAIDYNLPFPVTKLNSNSPLLAT